MRVPIRRGGKYTFLKPDPHLTQAKFDELSKKLTWLEKTAQPKAIQEVSRLAEMGDFSENTAYQMAKGRLRGINQRILDLRDHLKQAIIINATKKSDQVVLGSLVTLMINGQQRIYQILGSAETDPTAGIISHNSPIGSALLGHLVGDRLTIKLANQKLDCLIIKID